MYIGFFFFQAEDGIRDLVRSRGLGDVYKRQNSSIDGTNQKNGKQQPGSLRAGVQEAFNRRFAGAGPVSYTHLTLPTSDLV